MRLAVDTFLLQVLGVGAIFFLEGLGTPIPVEIPLGAIGAWMVRGRMTYWEAVMLMWASSVLGNALGYALGYYGGRIVIVQLMHRLRVGPSVLERMERWFGRFGLWTLLFTRWLNWGFAQNIWLCGITRVPFHRFFATMVLNDFFWAMGWTWVALTFVRQLSRLLRYQKPVLVIFAILALVALAFYYVYRRRRDQT